MLVTLDTLPSHLVQELGAAQILFLLSSSPFDTHQVVISSRMGWSLPLYVTIITHTSHQQHGALFFCNTPVYTQHTCLCLYLPFVSVTVKKVWVLKAVMETVQLKGDCYHFKRYCLKEELRQLQLSDHDTDLSVSRQANIKPPPYLNHPTYRWLASLHFHNFLSNIHRRRVFLVFKKTRQSDINLASLSIEHFATEHTQPSQTLMVTPENRAKWQAG